ncbi:MAG TPA: PH domain-containing protein [Flavobacterium sp.]|nr:PH domain-containing protein [Flavobacterium sp.]
MNSDFSQPQRQSQIGVLVMFADTMRKSVRAFWPFLLLWIFKLDEVSKLWLVLGGILFIIIISVAAYLRYLNFTFHIDVENDEFIINDGIFNKTKTAIRLDKIQQVNINQSIVQRIIGVYALDVDTAGSGKKEGKIDAVSHDLALALKARLLDNDIKVARNARELSIEDQPVAAQHPFLRISFLSLLKVGITSNYIRSIGLILAFLVTIVDNLRQLSQYEAIDEGSVEAYFDRQMIGQSIALIIVMMFALVLIINVIRVIFKYYNFQVTKQSGSLLLTFGLLNTKNTILKPARVQIASVTQNYFQKKLDVSELRIKQAGVSQERHEKSSHLDIPGCNSYEQDEILKLIFGQLPERGKMLKPNFRKLAFAVFLAIVLPLCVFFIVASNQHELAEYAWVAAVYTIFVGMILYFSFRNYKLFVGKDFIIKQSGAWDIRNETIESGKIQAITTSQLFWHKSINIGTLVIHTAGGNIEFQLGNFDVIKQYVNLWLYEIETTDSNWM